ncbi:MAG: TolC family protein [Vulcanimicrobiaceae bacterium]
MIAPLLAVLLATAPSSPPPLSAMAGNAGVLSVFSDLSLAQAERDALPISPDVAAAAAAVARSSAALAAARAAFGPALVGGYLLAPQGGPNGSQIAQRLTSVGLQTTVGDLVAYSPLVAAADAELRAAQAKALAADANERVKVAGLYFGALKARAIRGARDQALALAQRERAAAQVRVHAGDAPQLDVVRAEVAVARATADDQLAAAADDNALDALKTETGESGPLLALESAPASLAPVPTPQEAVALADRLRPEIAAARATTASARASAVAAERRLLPAVTFGAGYETGIDSGVHVSAPTLNVNLAFPLGGAARARADEAKATVAEDRALEAGIVRQIELAVAAAARNLAAAVRASAASEDARVQAERELAATSLGYRSGALSSLDLEIARVTETQAVVNALSARYDEAAARATLEIELGA